MMDILGWIVAAYCGFGLVLSGSPMVRDIIALACARPGAPGARWKTPCARIIAHLGMALAWPLFLPGAVTRVARFSQPGTLGAIATVLRSYRDPDTVARVLRGFLPDQ